MNAEVYAEVGHALGAFADDDASGPKPPRAADAAARQPLAVDGDGDAQPDLLAQLGAVDDRQPGRPAHRQRAPERAAPVADAQPRPGSASAHVIEPTVSRLPERSARLRSVTFGAFGLRGAWRVAMPPGRRGAGSAARPPRVPRSGRRVRRPTRSRRRRQQGGRAVGRRPGTHRRPPYASRRRRRTQPTWSARERRGAVDAAFAAARAADVQAQQADVVGPAAGPLGRDRRDRPADRERAAHRGLRASTPTRPCQALLRSVTPKRSASKTVPEAVSPGS